MKEEVVVRSVLDLKQNKKCHIFERVHVKCVEQVGYCCKLKYFFYFTYYSCI